MDNLANAKEVLKHLDISEAKLPEFLMDDLRMKNSLQGDAKILAHYNEDSLFTLKTVRFLKDFKRFNAGVHVQTNNKSFIRTAEVFKLMGVKNYYFHLQLNNPLLINVDPWDPHLTKEEKAMIHAECNQNIWYIIREVIKIDGRRFIANRAVISFIWCCLNHIPTTILMPRQRGKAQPKRCKVLLKNGVWKRIGDIKIGDMVIAGDGSETKVTNVYPQGMKDVYTLTFEDGRKAEGCLEHLWDVFDRETNKWETIQTKEVIKRLGNDRHLYIPLMAPTICEDFPHRLEPYKLGLMFSRKIKHQYTFSEKGEWRIPKNYLAGSHRQRLDLLAGILDENNTVVKRSLGFDVKLPSSIAEDVVYICRSLGMKATSYRRNTRKGISIVYIRSSNNKELFKNKFKQESLAQTVAEEVLNSKLKIVSVVKNPEQEDCVCIEVDNDQHRYITEGFTVTHNTVGMQVLTFIMQYIVGRGMRGALITLAASNRMQFVNALKKIRSSMPDYLINVSYKDKDAGGILSYQAWGEEDKNTFEIRVPAGGEDGADNVARGGTFEYLLYDEPAWTKYIENIINGSGPATLTAQKNAREKGIPYFTAKATTPNSVLKPEGKYMYEDFKSSTEWREKLFDSFSETHLVYRVLKSSPVSTTAPKIAMMYNHLQLGLGKEWIKQTMDKLNLSWSKAKIDLLMMWTEEGSNKLFDDKVREQLNEGKADICFSEEIRETGLFIDWYVKSLELKAIKEDPNEFMTFGVDTSDAAGKDACTMVIRRNKTGEVLGTGRYAMAFLDDVTDVIFYFLLDYKRSLGVIERNRAAYIFDRLLIMLPPHDEDPFKRLYNEIYQDPVKYKNEMKELKDIHPSMRRKEFYLKFKSKFGFVTDATSRKSLYGFIHEAVNNTGGGIRNHILIDELIGLEVSSDGRIDHGSKGHDDMVIAWLLPYWFFKMGYNKDFYGIPSGATLIDITPLKGKDVSTQYTREQIQFFINVKERINKLTQELLEAESDVIAIRIEAEIRKLTELIPKEFRKTITIDELIEDAKAERNKKAMERRIYGQARFR